MRLLVPTLIILALTLSSGYIGNVTISHATLVSKGLTIIVLGSDEFWNATERAYDVFSMCNYDEILYLSTNLTLTPRANMTANSTNLEWALTNWLKNNSDSDTQVMMWIDSHGGGLKHKPPQNPLDDEYWEIIDGNTEMDSDEGLEITEGLIGQDVDGDGQVRNDTWVGVDESVILYPPEGKQIVWDDNLTRWLEGIEYRRMIIPIMTCKNPMDAENETKACLSGGLIDDLSAPRRIIITPTNETYPSHFNHTTGISFFAEPFLNALDISNQEAQYYADQYPTDRKISVFEAYWYAREHDMARKRVRNPSGIEDNDTFKDIYPDWKSIDECPWIDFGGNSLPTFRDCMDIGVGDGGFDENDTALADYTWGDAQHGYYGSRAHVNEDYVVDIYDLDYPAICFGNQFPLAWTSMSSLADLNIDNIVDIFDLAGVALEFGSSYPWTDSILVEDIETEQNATVSVYPNVISICKNDTFSMNVTIAGTAALYGWEFKLYWNSSVLECTDAQTCIPDTWGQDFFAVGVGVQNDFNSTLGRYWKAVTAVNPAPAFNGNLTIATLTFKALDVGVTELKLMDVKLADASACPINHTTIDGSVTVAPLPLFMRSDQHTINGATMNKLLETQTSNTNSTSISRTDPENEAGGVWGIRVWKRSANGTEVELTSSSPAAVVSRSSSGQGLQSATWTCPATRLNPADSPVVRVYHKFDFQSSYTLSSQFTTVQLNATSLAEQTWTIHYYTQRNYNAQNHRTTISYYWDNGCNSRIENLNYS